MIKLPKISCLTATLGRIDWLKRTIQCYINQTYPKKELIIISQGKKEINQLISDHIKSLNRTDIQFFECSSKMSLGAMRNLSIEIANGEILCQWDDDDYYHHQRITNQYNNLLKEGACASVFQQHLKYYYQSGDIYWIDWSIEKKEYEKYLPGTIMFYKRIADGLGVVYPESGAQSDREEDLCLLQKILKIGKITPINKGEHYIYTYHGDNIYWLEHHNYVLAKRVLNIEELLARKSILIETFKSVGIDKPVKVRSLDGIAFEYLPESI